MTVTTQYGVPIVAVQKGRQPASRCILPQFCPTTQSPASIFSAFWIIGARRTPPVTILPPTPPLCRWQTYPTTSDTGFYSTRGEFRPNCARTQPSRAPGLAGQRRLYDAKWSCSPEIRGAPQCLIRDGRGDSYAPAKRLGPASAGSSPFTPTGPADPLTEGRDHGSELRRAMGGPQRAFPCLSVPDGTLTLPVLRRLEIRPAAVQNVYGPHRGVSERDVPGSPTCGFVLDLNNARA